MQRRQFIQSSAAFGLAASVSATAATPPASTAAARFRLLRADSAERDAVFVESRMAACRQCSAETARISIDALHAADGAAVLEEFALRAIFQLDDRSTAPFVAWQYRGGAMPVRSDRASSIASRQALPRFELEFRLAQDGADLARESLPLTDWVSPLLVPGHYVLLGPRRDGQAVRTRRLRHSGDVAAPLAGPRDFDYLALRIDAAA